MDALAVGTVLLCPAVLPALLAQERGRCLRKRNENNLDPTISTVGKSRDSFRGPHDEQASPIPCQRSNNNSPFPTQESPFTALL